MYSVEHLTSSQLIDDMTEWDGKKVFKLQCDVAFAFETRRDRERGTETGEGGRPRAPADNFGV